MGREETEGAYGIYLPFQLERTLYTATLFVMVNRGLPPPSPAWANFIMMECMKESCRCHNVYSVVCNALNVRASAEGGGSVYFVFITIYTKQSSFESGKRLDDTFCVSLFFSLCCGSGRKKEVKNEGKSHK
jgi:hypothetical protein